MFASFCSVRTLTMVNLKLSMQCCWVSCWEELAVLSSLQHTTGYRMFLVAGSKKLKLISLNKRLPRKHKVEWLLIWLIQQLCVIFTDHIFFFLLCYLQYVRAVLTLASMMITRYSLPPFHFLQSDFNSSMCPDMTTSREREGLCLPFCSILSAKKPIPWGSPSRVHMTPDRFTWFFLTQSLERQRELLMIGLDQSGPTFQVWGCSHILLKQMAAQIPQQNFAFFFLGRRGGADVDYNYTTSSVYCTGIVDGTSNCIISFNI